MVRLALIGLLLVIALARTTPADAQRRVEVRLPDCASPHVDPVLLRELLEIELGDVSDGAIEVALGDALCDEASESLAVMIRDPASDAARRDVITMTSDLDPRSRARAMALAIAERARLAVAMAIAERRSTGSAESAASSEHGLVASSERALVPRSALGVFDDHAEALASPAAPLGVAPDRARLPATLGLAVRGRIAPLLPSWALGLRGDIGASLDATWSFRGELFATWSRGSASEGDTDAAVVGAAAALGASMYRDAAIDLVASLRVEAGVLVAVGTLAGGMPGYTSTHPWGTLGLELGATWWIAPELALALDLGVSGVVFGTRIVSAPSGTRIDLSVLTIDVGAGIRVPI